MLTAIFLICVILLCTCLAVWWIGQMPPLPPPVAAFPVKWLLYGVVILFAIFLILRVAGMPH